MKRLVEQGLRKNKYLILGSGGNLGRALYSSLEKKVSSESILRTFRDPTISKPNCFHFDLESDFQNINIPLEDVDVAFICTAKPMIQYCEDNKELSWQINVVKTLELIQLLRRHGIFVVFLSSNLAYDGQAPDQIPGPPFSPQTELGRHKARVSQHILETDPQGIAIVELSKVLQPEFPLFKNWLDQIAQGKDIHPFKDKWLAPIYIEDTAELIIKIAQEKKGGIYQYSAREDISYLDAAMVLAQKFKIPSSSIKPISVQNLDPRFNPRHSTLSCALSPDALPIVRPDPIASVLKALEGS